MNCPSGDEVHAWLEAGGDDPALGSIPAICADNLGLFLFLKYCAHNGDLTSALFIEAAIKIKVRLPGVGGNKCVSDHLIVSAA